MQNYSLGPFVKKISNTQTGVMIEQLLKSLLNAEKDGHRESASYGLKTIINKIPQKSSALLTEKLVPELTASLVDSVCFPKNITSPNQIQNYSKLIFLFF